MSEEQEERIEIDIDNNNGNFEESSDIAEPLEIIREEVVEVVENVPSVFNGRPTRGRGGPEK